MKALVAAALIGLGLLGSSCGSDNDQPEAQPAGPCRIAFRVRTEDHADAPSDIYVVNPDGTGRRNLTRSPSLFEWSPLWSPDGRKIAFTAQEADLSATLVTDIFVIDADGSSRRRLTDRAYSAMGTWSPDGRTIFYTQETGDGTAWAMNADGSEKRLFKGFGADAVVSPDGEQVAGTRNSGLESAAYYGSPDVYVAKANGDGGRWLTRAGDTELFGWSPDGQWVLYRRMLERQGLYIVKPDGSGRKRLTRSEDYDATWSPNGRLILYVTQSPPRGIYVVSIDGRRRRLTRPSGDDLFPSWSPGGTRIVFSRNSWEIWAMDHDGTDLRPIAQPTGSEIYESPAWSPACR